MIKNYHTRHESITDSLSTFSYSLLKCQYCFVLHYKIITFDECYWINPWNCNQSERGKSFCLISLSKRQKKTLCRLSCGDNFFNAFDKKKLCYKNIREALRINLFSCLPAQKNLTMFFISGFLFTRDNNKQSIEQRKSRKNI
jgi:hypothetical protein